MFKSRNMTLLLALFAATVLAGACGPDPDPVNPAGNTTGQQENANLVNDLADLESAVIRIEAQSTEFAEDGSQNRYTGSGFFIDESGIAVTNNHVVTGSSSLEVYVKDAKKPRSARVLGVSECSDLAVIQVDGGGFRYLNWYTKGLERRLPVTAAGYPADTADPQYAETSGSVVRPDTDGDTNWASVSSVIEHDAKIRPGNSGGPLVDDSGKVVGVNYAGLEELDYNFAVGSEDALSDIEQLRQGNDVDSIGINGEAVNDGQGSGIYVYAVESGSPASNAGVRAGDYIRRLEGEVLADDAPTMADYCKILRSNTPEDVMSIEVIRNATGEILEGELNGKELEVVSTFGSEQGGNSASGEVSGEFAEVTDDSGAITMSAPVEWEYDGAPGFVGDIEDIPSLYVSPDATNFIGTYEIPGVAVYASPDLLAEYGDPNAVLDTFDYSDDCEYAGREDIGSDGAPASVDIYVNCGAQGQGVALIAVVDEANGYMAFTYLQATPDFPTDGEIFDQISGSLEINF